jgi:hypothetical protein
MCRPAARLWSVPVSVRSASRFGVPHADPLAGRRRKELDERRRSAPSHVYERIGPVRLRPVYRVEELGRGSQLRVSQRARDHRRVCVISVCCIHPNFLSGLSGEVRHSKAGGYSSLAYRLVGYEVLFGLGALVTAIGIGLLAYALRRQPAAWLIWVSVAVLVSAAVLWLWHLYRRTLDPVAFAEGRWPRWPLLAYFMLTEIGLAILGYALLSSDLLSWIGWMLIGSMVLLFALTLIYRDMPPSMFYLVTLIAGIAFV